MIQRQRQSGVVLAVALAACVCAASRAHAAPGQGSDTARHRTYHEVELRAREPLGNPFVDTEVQVVFVRPDGSEVTVDAFFDGDETYRARAYCRHHRRLVVAFARQPPLARCRRGTLHGGGLVAARQAARPSRRPAPAGL